MNSAIREWWRVLRTPSLLLDLGTYFSTNKAVTLIVRSKRGPTSSFSLLMFESKRKGSIMRERASMRYEQPCVNAPRNRETINRNHGIIPESLMSPDILANSNFT